MIPSREEITRSIYGAWQMARLDAGGMRWFDLSVDGFFNSFFAAVLLAPFYLVLVLLHLQPGEAISERLIVEGLAYAVGWAAFPLIMIPLCRNLGLGRTYVGYIIAYNWSQVVVMALWLPLTIVTATVANRDTGAMIALIGLVAVLYYLWFVTRTALQTTPLIAAGVVLVEHLTSLLVHTVFDRLL